MPRHARSLPERAVVALLVLLLGYGVVIAARTGLADAYAEPAKYYLQSKRDADEALTTEEWQAIHDSLMRATALAPGDPANISELGRLYRIQLEADNLGADEILRIGDRATRYYQAALALRPTWSWDWANLAEAKYQQYQDASSVYQEALVHAVEFGPRERRLAERVVEMGSHSWGVLAPAAAEAVLTAAERALERDPESLPDMPVAADRWRPICGQASSRFSHLKRRCETLGLT